MLRRQLYLSAKAPDVNFSIEIDILRTAHRKNAQYHITGALISNRAHFLQLIEGPEPAMKQLMENIRNDPRHHILLETPLVPCSRRTFDGWDMGYGAVPTGDHLFSIVQQDGDRADFNATAETIHARMSLYKTLQEFRMHSESFRQMLDFRDTGALGYRPRQPRY